MIPSDPVVDALAEATAALAADLAYLQVDAFEFSLEINPHAGVYDTPEDHDQICNRDLDDWLSADQRNEAYRTGRFVRGFVYPCGSVSFYAVQGTDLPAVVATCARLCREEQDRWRAGGNEPSRPKTSAGD